MNNTFILVYGIGSMISRGISNPDIGTPEKKEQLVKFWSFGEDMLHKYNS